MKPLMTIEISIKELGKSGCPEGIRAFRQAGIVLYWTAIPDLDAYALNLYAPPDQVFWDFDIYTSLLMAEHAFCRSYGDERIKHVNSVLTRLSRQAGHKKKSGFARGVFGGWAGSYAFFPNNDTMGFHLAFDGHKSIIVPAVDREAVQAHFDAQAKHFGDGSMSPYPERYLKDSIGDLDNTVHHKLLAEHIMQKNADGRAWLYEQARQLDNATSITQLAASLDPRFGLKGLISLYPVAARFIPFVDMECYAEVLRFRTKVALEICRLPSMEWLVIAIRDSMELGEYPGGVKEEMLAMLEPRLQPYRQLIGFEFPSQAGLKK